jgi:hypothetical protein
MELVRMRKFKVGDFGSEGFEVRMTPEELGLENKNPVIKYYNLMFIVEKLFQDLLVASGHTSPAESTERMEHMEKVVTELIQEEKTED